MLRIADYARDSPQQSSFPALTGFFLDWQYAPKASNRRQMAR
jgi:hypothetical protein